MTRDEHIAEHKAKLRAAYAARNGGKRILKSLRVNEISMVDAPAAPTFAEAIVYPASNRVEKLADLPGMRQHRKRIMRSFRIDEISAVDKPAQEGAKAVLIKRAAEADADAVAEFRREFPHLFTKAETARQEELEALASRLAKAAAARIRREQEASTMPDQDTDDFAIRKRSDDALADMNESIRKRAPGVSAYQAAEHWRKANPVLFKALQASSPMARSPAPVSKRDHTVFWNLLVDQIAKRDSVPKTVAAERARAEDPGAFRRLQEA